MWGPPSSVEAEHYMVMELLGFSADQGVFSSHLDRVRAATAGARVAAGFPSSLALHGHYSDDTVEAMVVVLRDGFNRLYTPTEQLALVASCSPLFTSGED